MIRLRMNFDISLMNALFSPPSLTVDGIVDDLLSTFDTELHPYPRDGTTLKHRWARLQSLSTVASNNFEKSGQSDAEAFTEFTRGDDSLCYMHCVYMDHRSLEAVLRSIPRQSGGESEVEEITRSRSTIPSYPQSGRKRRRDNNLSDIAQVVKQMATEQTTSTPIITQHSPGPVGSHTGTASGSQAASGTKSKSSATETCSINTPNGGGCMHSSRRRPCRREKRKGTRINALGRTRAGSGSRAGRVAIALVYAIERIDASTPRRGTG